MSENKWERLLRCEGENCQFVINEASASAASVWQFSPNMLKAEETWRWKNESENRLRLTARLKWENNFFLNAYENLLWLDCAKIMKTANLNEETVITTKIKQGWLNWLNEENESYQIELDASSEAEIVWTWSHPFWTEVKGEKVQNKSAIYDWVIEIDEIETEKESQEATKSGEESESSASGQLTESKITTITNNIVETKTITQIVEETGEEEKQKDNNKTQKTKIANGSEQTEGDKETKEKQEIEMTIGKEKQKESRLVLSQNDNGSVKSENDFGWQIGNYWWIWPMIILTTIIGVNYWLKKRKIPVNQPFSICQTSKPKAS